MLLDVDVRGGVTVVCLADEVLGLRLGIAAMRGRVRFPCGFVCVHSCAMIMIGLAIDIEIRVVL